ncbi:hypothetical protein F66182_6025 [Fusarium sp. NRRL 66182]|nr:hypothetical protein F66182_6025 [Fusarium sp. NRRL 66182]
MQHDQHQTRQIAANLDHDRSALYTHVQHGPDSHSAGEASSNQYPIVNSPKIHDVGWDADNHQPQEYALDGVKNQHLWLLVRRFNKRVFHLKHAPSHPREELDFNVAEAEQFSPNKLRAQIERLYMGVFLGLLMFKQHISRLQSWREPRRTSSFCFVYFTAWYLNFIIPTILLTLMALLLSSNARRLLFPPFPPSIVHPNHGTLMKPSAGVLSTTDSATGAPEGMKGEALEREASNFVTGLVALSINILTDNDPQHDEPQKGGSRSEKFPDAHSLATSVATAKDKAAGVDYPSWDKTKAPMQDMMQSKIRILMHAICSICDLWERCANLLNPPTPFPQNVSRYRITAVFLPVLIFSTSISCYTLYRIASFGIGVGFFGSVFLTKTCKGLKRSITELVFKGVPTDSQLTITLLREGERNKTPLPPPSLPSGPPPDEPHLLGHDILGAANGDLPLGATQGEVQEAVRKDGATMRNSGGNDHESCEPGSGGKRRGKLLGIIRPVAAAAVKTITSLDKVRAKAGSESAKNRVGATTTRQSPSIAGPVEFTCRWEGDRGFVYITTDSVSPCLCFSKNSSAVNLNKATDQEMRPAWAMPVSDITTLNKHSGYGTKTKLLAGWALESEIVDGLEIIDSSGRSILITAIARRDQLFNRLCAVGDQKWEIW